VCELVLFGADEGRKQQGFRTSHHRRSTSSAGIARVTRDLSWVTFSRSYNTAVCGGKENLCGGRIQNFYGDGTGVRLTDLGYLAITNELFAVLPVLGGISIVFYP
jgi:hypothetical protein